VGWYNFIKRYVWDDSRTPYLIKPINLNRYQADKELYIYALFLTILFSTAAFFFLLKYRSSGFGEFLLGGVFSLLVVGCAILLTREKITGAAWLLTGAPVSAFFYVFFDGLPREITFLEKMLLLVICALWAVYSRRVIRICQHYGDYAPGSKPPMEKRGT